MTASKKDRGVDKPVASKEPEQVCPKAFLNLGEPLTLSDGRTVTVKDISLDSWLTTLANSLPVIMEIAEFAESKTETELAMVLLANAQVKNAFYELIAHACQELTPEDVKNLPAMDTLKVAIRMMQVVRFKEVKELFTQLVSGLKAQ